MKICIPEDLVNRVEQIVTSKEDSSSRLSDLSEVFGGNSKMAQEINLIYEKSLLLKNQETAIGKFIDNISEVGAKKKAVLKQKLADNVARRNEIIRDEELFSISKDIFDRKYKLDIPEESVIEIAKLKNEASDLKPKIENTPDGSAERLDYGRKIVEMSDVIEGLSNPTQDLGFLKTIGYELQQERLGIQAQNNLFDKSVETIKVGGRIITSPVYKSIRAAVDASFALRQGYKVLASSPKTWAQNMTGALGLLKKTFDKKAQDVLFKEFKADIVSRKLYQEASDAGLALGVVEEFFPTPLAEKVPILGNLFKSSDLSFTMFSQGSRMGLFEKLYEGQMKLAGVVTKEEAQGFAKLANSISGRGFLGKLEQVSGLINKVAFSGRFIKSQLDTFTMPFNTSLPSAVRREALKSSVKTFGSIGAIMYTASLFTDVGFDPRDSRFGKAKVPGTNRWVDLSAGLGSYVTLVARSGLGVASTMGLTDIPAVKNSSGEFSRLNEDKFGAKTVQDVLIDFSGNKLSPAFGELRDFMRGRTFKGDRPTLLKSATNLVKPISTENVYEAFQNEELVTALIISILDAGGMSNVDYDQFKKK